MIRYRALARGLVGAPFDWMRHRLRRMLGRPSRREIPFRIHFRVLLHVLGIRRLRRVTATPLPGEGAGSQAISAASAMGFADLLGLEYLHSPFGRINHADRPEHEYAHSWERFFNLGEGEAEAGSTSTEALDFNRYWPYLLPLFGFEDLSQVLEHVAPVVREKYYANKSIPHHPGFRVCVHVRRGDVDTRRHRLWTDSAVVAGIVGSVSEILDAHCVNHEVHVHSQGESGDFAEFDGCCDEFFLDRDPMWTLGQLIEADVLVMAKSTFSYVAGLIGRGITIYDPFGLPSQPGWLTPPAGGGLDRSGFQDRLGALLAGRRPEDRWAGVSRLRNEP